MHPFAHTHTDTQTHTHRHTDTDTDTDTHTDTHTHYTNTYTHIPGAEGGQNEETTCAAQQAMTALAYHKFSKKSVP